MKLNEVIRSKNYDPAHGKPAAGGKGINWSIPANPHYTLLPELMDSIQAGLSQVTPEQKAALMVKYNFKNTLELHVMPYEQMFKLDADLHQLLGIPY